jgi:curved DNA-binding protein CbpA
VTTDHYRVLGVAHIASRDEIERAYRGLVALYRPVRNKDPDAEARLVEINEAHEVLSDPKRRSTYDFELWKSLS